MKAHPTQDGMGVKAPFAGVCNDKNAGKVEFFILCPKHPEDMRTGERMLLGTGLFLYYCQAGNLFCKQASEACRYSNW